MARLKVEVGALHVNRTPGACRWGEWCDHPATEGLKPEHPLFCMAHWTQLRRISDMPLDKRYVIRGSKGELPFEDDE